MDSIYWSVLRSKEFPSSYIQKMLRSTTKERPKCDSRAKTDRLPSSGATDFSTDTFNWLLFWTPFSR